jgi:DNA invertase Pin-like site-specific DNA recombinase
MSRDGESLPTFSCRTPDGERGARGPKAAWPVTVLAYARVSTAHQSVDMQVQALEAAGAERIWTEHMSGGRDDRPELAALLNYARAGDVLMVWRLDRLGRSLPHLLTVVADLDSRGVQLRSLTEAIDTTTAGGRLVFHVFGAVAQFERALAAERSAAGVAAARAAGRIPGRPKLPATTLEAVRKLDQTGTSRANIARSLGISRSSVYRALAWPNEAALPAISGV